MSQIKELMEAHFLKLDEYSKDHYGTPPIVPYSEKKTLSIFLHQITKITFAGAHFHSYIHGC